MPGIPPPHRVRVAGAEVGVGGVGADVGDAAPGAGAFGVVGLSELEDDATLESCISTNCCLARSEHFGWIDAIERLEVIRGQRDMRRCVER